MTPDPDGRLRVLSASPYEASVGFCRAVRVGDRVLVSGTTPVWPDGTVAQSVAAQAHRCWEIVVTALVEAGCGAEHVVRTRTYLLDAADAAVAGEVHRSVFAAAVPASTMLVVAGLLDPRWRLEVEAEAVCPDGHAGPAGR